jgi:MFS family permease
MTSVSYGQLLRRNRNFRLLWGGQIVSQLGDWFSAITVQSLLIRYTHSAGSLAWFMIASMLPGFLLGPLAGVLVDRLPRKTVMIGADLLRVLIALGLLFFRGPGTVWVAYACIAGLASFAAFFEPARTSTIPNVTSEEELVTANALSSVTWSILLTSGALVGGIVGHFLGTDAAFILNSLSFLGSAALLAPLKAPPSEPHPDRRHGFGELLEGFKYVGRHPQVRSALRAKMGWGLAGGVQVLIPVYGGRLFQLHGDPGGQLSISLLYAAGGLGTALGPLIARRFTGRDLPRIRWAIGISFLLGGFYYACMGFAPSLAAVGLFLLLARFHGAIIWVFSTVLLQMLTEDRYRGRVFAAEMSLFTGTMMLSSIATGWALDSGRASAMGAAQGMGVISVAAGLLWVTDLARRLVPAAPAPEAAGGVVRARSEPEHEE